MTKILHISKYYNPHIGGIESTCENIVHILKESKKYQQKIICFGNEKIDKIDNVPVIRVKSHLKIRSQSIALRYTHVLKKTIKEFKPDVILFHAPNPFVTRSLLKCHYNGKIIVFHHADIIKQRILKKFVKRYINKLYFKAHKIITTSNEYLNKSDDLINFKNKCTVINLCYRNDNVILHEYEKSAVTRIRNEYLLPIAIFTGRHVGYKGLEYAIKAFKQVPNVTFLVAGSGPLTNKLRKLAADSPNIHFIGVLSHKVYRLTLNAADFFVFPSWQKNEAFGISLLEGLAAGKPAITFKIEGSAVNFLNLNGITGIECENGNINQLIKAIETLRDSPDLVKQYGEAAMKRSREMFSYDKFKENILNFFANITI